MTVMAQRRLQVRFPLEDGLFHLSSLWQRGKCDVEFHQHTKIGKPDVSEGRSILISTRFPRFLCFPLLALGIKQNTVKSGERGRVEIFEQQFLKKKKKVKYSLLHIKKNVNV